MKLRAQFEACLPLSGMARFDAFNALMKRMDDLYYKNWKAFPREAYGNLMHNCRGSSCNREYWTRKIEAHDPLMGIRSGKPIKPEALSEHMARWDKELVDNCESAITLCEPFEGSKQDGE